MYGGDFANSTAGNYLFSSGMGGIGSVLTGGNFFEGAAIGAMNAGLNHLKQGINSYLELIFDGNLLSVLNTKTNETIYSTEATLGNGKYMNDPDAQNIPFEGTIPEGEYVTPFQGLTSNCVNWTSLGLWLNGIPNIGLHPYLLHGSMAIYNSGIYNILSYQLLRRQ
jgi:hypothetical protein